VAATEVDIGRLIARTPGIRGGQPHVVGTGVTVRRLIGLVYCEQLTPEAIVDDMPHLTLAGIHAALAYYHANKERLDAEFADEEHEEAKIVEEWTQSQRRK